MKHIVFDVDGTLIDTTQSLLQSLQDTLQTLTGKTYPLSQLTFAMGIPSRECFAHFPVTDIPEAIALWDRNAEARACMVRIFPGIPETLACFKARGYRLGIVTSRSWHEFNGVVAPMGIAKYFDTIICSDDTVLHKPHGDPLRKYAERAGARLEDMVYIGDSPYDKGCAADAGVPFYLAAWGAQQPVDVSPGHHISAPEDLAGVL